MKLWLKSVGQAFLYMLWFAWIVFGVVALVLWDWWGVPVFLFVFVTWIGTMIWSLEKP